MSAKLEGEKAVVFCDEKSDTNIAPDYGHTDLWPSGSMQHLHAHAWPRRTCWWTFFWDVVSISQNYFLRMFNDDIPNLLDGMNYIR